MTAMTTRTTTSTTFATNHTTATWPGLDLLEGAAAEIEGGMRS